MLDPTSDANAVGGFKPHVLPSPYVSSSADLHLITQGAEALVYRTTYLDSRTPAALKFRPSKPYRHFTLDQRLTKQRVLAEARILVKLSACKQHGIHVPALLSLEWDASRNVNPHAQEQSNFHHRGSGSGAWLLMEWIEGTSMKQLLRDFDAQSATASIGLTPQKLKELLQRLGKAVAVMHSKGGVVHGDLTTSNIMVRANSESRQETATSLIQGDIVLIDFGLAIQSVQDEDRAVDLYVLERAFGSTHPNQETMFDTEVLQNGYRDSFKGANLVLKRLEDVRLRGRKRSMIG